jgi:hypothetical protein
MPELNAMIPATLFKSERPAKARDTHSPGPDEPTEQLRIVGVGKHGFRGATIHVVPLGTASYPNANSDFCQNPKQGRDESASGTSDLWHLMKACQKHQVLAGPVVTSRLAK